MASKMKRSNKVKQRVVVRPARPVLAGPITPVQIVHGGALADGQAALVQTKYTVPTGKTLAIEFVAVSGAVPDGQRLGQAILWDGGCWFTGHGRWEGSSIGFSKRRRKPLAKRVRGALMDAIVRCRP